MENITSTSSNLTTEKTFNGTVWRPSNLDLNEDTAFEVAQKNNISINLSKLLTSKQISDEDKPREIKPNQILFACTGTIGEKFPEQKIINALKKNIELGKKKTGSLNDVLLNYSKSKNFGIPFTFTQEEFNKFKLITIKNVMQNGKNIGYLAISENANDIRTAIDERKTFIIRTAIAVGIVILIFSFVLNRYFLKPIKNLVSYTKTIKDKKQKTTNIDNLKLRNDELGLLSSSLDDMTLELQKRIRHAENFSTDLVHEIRNPLASLKSASEILHDTNDINQRVKLIDILSHDVQRIERLITDYSQILKDEVALSKEKIKKLDIEPIIKSVVDDFNNIYKLKRGIKISYDNDKKNGYFINGIENRIEQMIANLLDNAVSFSEDNKKFW